MHSSASSFDENQTLAGEYDDSDSKIIEKRTPLPLVQLFIVFFIQFAEPVTATVIYPFINQFVRETGITGDDERETGHFAGILQSVFFLAEAATVVGWGIASDRFGRRPTLLIGPLGLSLVMLGFGMSSNFWYLVFFRFMQGAFNGNIGISKSVMGELTDSTNVADVFAAISMMWSMGVTFGPILGGLLSRPATRWPDTLGKLQYLRSHPYFLPCFAASLVSFLSFLIGIIALKETSSVAIRQQEKKRFNIPAEHLEYSAPDASTPLTINGCTTTYGTNGGSIVQSGSFSDLEGTSYDADHKPLALRALLTPGVVTVMINYGFFNFLEMSFQVLIPLMWSTSVGLGGLGFTPYNIGVTMGIYGLVNAFMQICFLGRLIRRFGPRKVYRVSFSSLLVCFSGFPIASAFFRHAGGADWKVWYVVVVQLAAGIMVSSSLGAMQVMIQGVTPDNSALGTMNGMGQCVASIARSLAPSITSSLYALSLQHHLIGGHAVYCVLLVFVACGILFSFTLPNKMLAALIADYDDTKFTMMIEGRDVHDILL
ncbi:hypothetical protein AX15_003609 [Amanita polypyramis BW_CC]|nr:hypothetical protein AX15_003609 [Amanita polypyramis BW_CC]